MRQRRRRLHPARLRDLALGNVVGAAIAGVDPVWDLTVTNLLTIVLANALDLLVGFMLGVVIRSCRCRVKTDPQAPGEC